MYGSPFATALRVGLAVASALAFSAMPAAADTSSCPAPVAGGIHLELSNPHSGDSLQPGAYFVQGIAFDVTSPTGPAIDRVALFLDGDYLGDARLGQPNTAAVIGPYATAGFTATIKLPQPIGPAGDVRNFIAIAYPATGGSVSYSVPVGLAVPRSNILPSPDTCPTLSAGNRPDLSASPGTPAPSALSPSQPAVLPLPDPSVAADGQTLAMQPPDTQALFQAIFGSSAAVQWAQQHNGAIGATPRP